MLWPRHTRSQWPDCDNGRYWRFLPASGEWSYCRNGILASPSLPSPSQPISSSIVSLRVSPSRSRSQSLPSAFSWLGLGCHVLHPSPATRTSPARARPPQSAVSSRSKNWPCLLSLTGAGAAARQSSEAGARVLWHRIWMTTPAWILTGACKMVCAWFWV